MERVLKVRPERGSSSVIKFPNLVSAASVD